MNASPDIVGMGRILLTSKLGMGVRVDLDLGAGRAQDQEVEVGMGKVVRKV